MTIPGYGKTKAHARLSTVEIAIRAYAKRFLAHPLVVQQLEAVWAGSIVFHSVADTLHRSKPEQKPQLKSRRQQSSYGATASQTPTPGAIYNKDFSSKGKTPASEPVTRRTVTMYDPSDASLFKLSRLRVPRYRQLFSTLSYAVMLSLFLSVLVGRSTEITALELVFWFWGAGYMLDELVGFSEQGFGLYIISVWNSFDIGILLMFIVYYVLRLYGILMPDEGGQQRRTANMAYDVLGATAVLLFPRLFSVLDHYRYFSQLLIAFRMMAVDLSAILILIVISCSGFFIAFTFSFSDTNNDTSETAYTIFKIVMGFTPAAWDIWDDYNILGKAILSVFLVICHFLIVTILITVLTNSFMAVVQNSNQEHQFLFAVNTISMVKSDALFSYVPPTNILGWMLSPIRYIMPFRQFVWFNRTVIKITHIPMLLVIFMYERLILSSRYDDAMDLLEHRGRDKTSVPAFSIRGTDDVFSPGPRLREPSLATYRKDQALEEVFRQPGPYTRQGRGNDIRRTSLLRTKSTNVVQDWMQGVGREGGAISPMEQPESIVDRLETRKPPLRRHRTTPVQHHFQGARSIVSDPEDIHQPFEGFGYIHEDSEELDMNFEDLPQQTDADGDDELATNDDDYDAATHDESFHSGHKQTHESDKENSNASQHPTGSQRSRRPPLREIDGSAVEDDEEEGLESPNTPIAKRNRRGEFLIAGYSPKGRHPSSEPEPPPTQQRIVLKRGGGQHIRTASSATILFAPLDAYAGSYAGASSSKQMNVGSPAKSRGKQSSLQEGTSTHGGSAPGGISLALRKQLQPKSTARSPKKSGSRDKSDGFGPLLKRKNMMSAPNLASFLAYDRRKPSFNARALDLASDIGDNRAVPNINLLSTSFGTQLEMAALRRRSTRPVRNFTITSDGDEDEDEENDDDDDEDQRSRGEDTRRLNKLMLARMSNLEEGFKDILREVKGLSRTHSQGTRSVADESEKPLEVRRIQKGRENEHHSQ